LRSIYILNGVKVEGIDQDQDTGLRMPNKWHMCKEGQAGNKKYNAAAYLCFLKNLASLQPAADRAASILPLVVSRGRSYGFLWACSIIKKNVRKGDPTPASIASKRSKTPYGVC
jgi:hypothetical protein